MKDHPEWGKYYEAHQVNNGCFILFDNNHESVHYYHQERCLQRYVPASTFNILNALVALETGIAPDEQMIIKWDSVVRPRAEWNKDLNMRQAFTVHAIPYFQQLAKRIGVAKMQHYLDTIKYGNMQAGTAVDSMWINNSLMISADEQVGFLKRLYFHELPFSERAQRIVHSMMLREDSADYKLYCYTGTANTQANDSTVYWLIGFAEKIENVKEPKGSMNQTGVHTYPYFFAQNFLRAKTDTTQNWADIRINIMHQVLKDYGAIPSK
jgi:beta-lactamase class D